MRGALVAVAAGAAAWAPAFRYDALPRRPTRRAAATTHGDQIVVALTREAGKNGGLARALAEHHIETVEVPCVSTQRTPQMDALLDSALLFAEDPWDWVVVTSPEAAKTFGRTVVLAASADADQRITRAFDLARVDVEQREKECLDAITALSEQEKAGDVVDAQAERLRQDAEHTVQQRRRSGISEETWDATIAAKLAAGLEPWTPRSDGILDFPHALYGTWLSVEVASDRLIGRRERLDDDKDLMLKALRKARGTDACATALFEAPATWLHPRASGGQSFEVMGNDVEVLSLFASKLARFAKELFRLEHRCDVRGVAFGETDCVVDCRVASYVRPAGLRVEFRVARGYPAAGFERAGLIGADGLLSVRLAASRGDDMLVGAAERALSARGLCGERKDGWFAARSTPGSLLRTLACVQGACDAPDGSAILQPAQ